MNEVLSAGHHEVTWKGRDGAGRNVSSGIYFMRFTAGDLDQTQRVTLIK